MKTHGINKDWMDPSVDPGKDFYLYCNGGYLGSTVLPPGYARWGSFLELRELSLERVHAIMSELAEDTSGKLTPNQAKIARFYLSGMDEAAIEEYGSEPLTKAFECIDQVTDRTSLAVVVALLHQIGVSAFFEFGSMPSFADSKQAIAAISQSGLGLPDRDYYLKDDQASVERRQKYVEHMTAMFELFGFEGGEVIAPLVLSLETKLARASMASEKMRDPNNINNIKALKALVKESGGFDFKTYFETVLPPVFDELNVLQPEYFRSLDEILSETAWVVIRDYLCWKLMAATAPYLAKRFADESFEFFGKTLTGVTEKKPRWKLVVSTVDAALGEAVGELYVARYFPPEARARVLSMIENGKAVMRQALESAEWLSPETREKQLTKLDRAKFKIGYPDKWKDYSPLGMEDCYVMNVLNSAAFAFRRDIEKIGKPVDETEWNMTPQTVNAYANPMRLEVVFPAAILQPPFFDVEADDASNYGGIMTVILHEFGHFFDDQGAQFDADGKLNMQWTAADYAHFMERIQLLRNQFSRFTVGPNQVHLKGDLVSGEAAADLNGARLSYRAFQLARAKSQPQAGADGYTDEQRFFIAFGQIWATITTPEYGEMQAMTDPHPPAQFRVNGTLAHMGEFAAAFNLADDAPIMLPPAERAHIW